VSEGTESEEDEDSSYKSEKGVKVKELDDNRAFGQGTNFGAADDDLEDEDDDQEDNDLYDEGEDDSDKEFPVVV